MNICVRVFVRSCVFSSFEYMPWVKHVLTVWKTARLPSKVASPFSFLNIYFFLTERDRETERQSMSGGGAEQERDTESEAGSRLRAVTTEPDTGLELTDLEIVT